ncbi:MAG TPA: YIP1 family protein, partial [Steroidobacteraceae bacterium]|nr:YIP1 family protein [Steroidobacteraceae bacterium]
MNNLALLSALAFEPRKAFDEIAQRPRFWFPLLLLLAASVGLSVWYCSVVDIQWLTDQTLRNSGLARRLSEEQMEAAIARSSRGGAIAQAIIAGPLVLVAIHLAEAVYLLLAGKITNVQRSFRQWFALSCWTSLPGVLAVIPAAMVLLGATSPQIPQADLQPLSFNELLLHLTPKDSGYLLWSNFGVLSLVSLYLSSLGVKLWSGRSWLFSVLFATLPVL